MDRVKDSMNAAAMAGAGGAQAHRIAAQADREYILTHDGDAEVDAEADAGEQGAHAHAIGLASAGSFSFFSCGCACEDRRMQKTRRSVGGKPQGGCGRGGQGVVVKEGRGVSGVACAGSCLLASVSFCMAWMSRSGVCLQGHDCMAAGSLTVLLPVASA